MRSTARRGKNFEELITNLVSEIELAVKWQRASILVAVYRSVAVLADAETSFEQRLGSLGLGVCKLKVNEQNYKIPAAVLQLQDRDHLVFSVTGLKQGGGPDGANAYRHLNLQREFFVENRIRFVLWLTELEAVELSRYAPDFWAFRHRVVEFTRERASRRDRPSGERIPLYDWTALLQSDKQTRIASCERLLTDLPDDIQALTMRADLLYEMAGLRWANGETPLSLEFLEQGLRLAQGFEEPGFRVRCLTAFGIVYTDLQRLEEAMSCHRQAAELQPSNPVPWMNLIETYRCMGQRSEGVAAFKKAAGLASGDPRPWNNVGNVYADLGRYEQAAEAYQKAISLTSEDVVPRLNLGHLYLEEERFQEASRILEDALGLVVGHPEVLKGLRARYNVSLDRISNRDGSRELLEIP
jgi:tetratricopeptide (TPR) repeat protein